MSSDEALKDIFHQVTRGHTMFTRRMAITIADIFFDKPMPMVLKLEQQGLLKPESYQWFVKNGGISARHVEQVRREAREALATCGRSAAE